MTDVLPTPQRGLSLGPDVLVGIQDSLSAAERAGGVVVRRYALAGTTVRLRFAGRAVLDSLARAFAHLEVHEDDSEPDLTVAFWDSASTGAEPPPRPSVPSEYAPGALFHFDEPPLRAAYQPGLSTLSVYKADVGQAWHWVEDASAQPYWDKASPIRQILFWWLAGRGYLQVHGAAVGRADGGVLLVGRGGSGKSTTALSTLGTDMLYAGDDYVAVTTHPEPRVQSLYNTGKLDPHHLNSLLPEFLPLLSNAERLEVEKAVMYVQDHYPEQTTHGFPLRAVLVPKVCVGPRESRIVEATRASAFAALAPSTIFQLHTAGSEALSIMSQLVARVPCYGLELGSDISAIPRAIGSFLDELTSDRR
jgi:hypothetical protein